MTSSKKQRPFTRREQVEEFKQKDLGYLSSELQYAFMNSSFYCNDRENFEWVAVCGRCEETLSVSSMYVFGSGSEACCWGAKCSDCGHTSFVCVTDEAARDFDQWNYLSEEDGMKSPERTEFVMPEHLSPETVSAIVERVLSELVVTQARLDVGSVGEGELQDASVYLKHLSVGCVGRDQIQRRAVGTDELGVGAVGQVQLKDNSVGYDELKGCAVREVHLSEDLRKKLKASSKLSLGENMVHEKHLSAGCVGQVQLKNDAVGSEELRERAVHGKHLSGGCVDRQHIGFGAVGSDELGGGVVGHEELEEGAVRAKHLSKDVVTYIANSLNSIPWRLAPEDFSEEVIQKIVNSDAFAIKMLDILGEERVEIVFGEDESEDACAEEIEVMGEPDPLLLEEALLLEKIYSELTKAKMGLWAMVLFLLMSVFIFFSYLR